MEPVRRFIDVSFGYKPSDAGGVLDAEATIALPFYTQLGVFAGAGINLGNNDRFVFDVGVSYAPLNFNLGPIDITPGMLKLAVPFEVAKGFVNDVRTGNLLRAGSTAIDAYARATAGMQLRIAPEDKAWSIFAEGNGGVLGGAKGASGFADFRLGAGLHF